MSNDPFEFIFKAADELKAFSKEIEVIQASLGSNTSPDDTMTNLINSGMNEMRTKSPIYSSVEEAEEVEKDKLMSYVMQRLNQILGDG